MSAVLTRIERKALVARRRRDSVFWGVVHLFGSLRLAMTLLITIAAACAVATFLESGFSAKVARAYIYKAPWFIFWLGLLCVNLAAAALTRWPWERRHVGFVVTHMGIITLLIGAMVGQKAGFEASVVLRKGDPPTNRLVLNETVVQVENAADGALYSMPFPVEVRRPRPDRPRSVPLPGNRGSRVVVTDYADHLDTVRELVAVPDATGGTGVELVMESAMMGQQLPVRLLAGTDETHDLFGLATIALDTPANQPVSGAASRRPVHESVVAFSKLPDSPVVVPRDGVQPSGCPVRLIEENGVFFVVAALGADSESVRLKAEPGTSAVVEGASGRIVVTVREFWPAFAMREGRPVSTGPEPGNPAARVDLEGGIDAPEERPKPRLLVAPEGETGRVAWRSFRGDRLVGNGTFEPGGTMVPGWADWQARLVAVHSSARFEEQLRPVPAGSFPPDRTRRPPPGIRAHLADRNGAAGPARWIVSGSAQVLEGGHDTVRVGFGLLTRPVPFRISLLNFSVPRDEGSDTPANFISTVRFDDGRTGRSVEGISRMNHPASFPGGWFATLSGINYKFSQASWNPDDLNETTLQVLYDPGWSLKWVGSLMICCGIGILFYLRPRSAAATPASPATEVAPSVPTEPVPR